MLLQKRMLGLMEVETKKVYELSKAKERITHTRTWAQARLRGVARSALTRWYL
jgi:hypothetical protein